MSTTHSRLLPADTFQAAVLRHTDPATRVVELDSIFRHNVHCYHGIDAWDRRGDRLLYLGFDRNDTASLVIREGRKGVERVIGQTRCFDYHTAAWQQWALDDTAVLFLAGEVDGSNRWALAPVDGSGPAQPVPALDGRMVRQVVDHGHQVWTYSQREIDQPQLIERVDLRTMQAETILTAEDAYQRLPKGYRFPGQYSFSHPVPNPSGTRAFFKLMITPDGRPTMHSAFFMLNIETGEISYHSREMSGHPFWVDDQRILNIVHTGDNVHRALILIDCDTGDVDKITDSVIEGPGHPSLSPDGRTYVTDSFANEMTESPIYLVDAETGVMREILRLNHRFTPTDPKVGYDPKVVTRGQPHPVWSPDGKRLLMHSNRGGTKYSLLVVTPDLS